MKVFWVICGIVLAGALVGWFGIGAGWGKSGSRSATSAGSRADKRPPIVWSGPRQGAEGRPVPTPTWDQTDTNSPLNVSTNWEDRVGELLVSDLEETEKARQLLQLFPTLPEEGQVELAQQLSFMLADEDYPLLAQYLTSATVPDAVLDALLSGLLIRTDEIQAPFLLAIATDDSHPRARQARTLLEGLLDQELDEDPSRWPQMVQTWLETQQQ